MRIKTRKWSLKKMAIACMFLLLVSMAACSPAPETTATSETVEKKPPQIPENSTFSIRFLDVGQADAAIVECDGHYMLIDGGNKHDSSKMYTILKESGINHLDLVVGTHPDADHIGGLPGALNFATADRVLSPVLEHDTESFLNKVKPEYAIISVGDGNNYGHPTKEALDRLEDVGAEVYRTDLQGEITVTSDGSSLTISSKKTASKDKAKVNCGNCW